MGADWGCAIGVGGEEVGGWLLAPPLIGVGGLIGSWASWGRRRLGGRLGAGARIHGWLAV